MNITRLLQSLIAVAVFMVVAWVIAGALGYHFALWTSLVISLGLTLVLNLFTGTFHIGQRRST